jgi:branched-chain amino acid transport system substrate-binding protein
VEYGILVTDYSPILSQAKTQLDQHENAAIFLAAFEGVANVLAQASGDQLLGSVFWYGADGSALSPAITSNDTGAAFAVKVNGFPCASFALEEKYKSRWLPVAEKIKAQTGAQPDPLALLAYDALNVAVRAFVQVGSADNIKAIKSKVMSIASIHQGITGSVALDETGDRATGSYGFWAVKPSGGGYAWVHVATYLPGSDGKPGTLVRQ